MTHGQKHHLVTLDGHALTTERLFAEAERWHREHDTPEVDQRGPRVPRDVLDSRPPRERVEDESGDLLALAMKRHGGKNPFL